MYQGIHTCNAQAGPAALLENCDDDDDGDNCNTVIVASIHLQTVSLTEHGTRITSSSLVCTGTDAGRANLQRWQWLEGSCPGPCRQPGSRAGRCGVGRPARQCPPAGRAAARMPVSLTS